MDPEETEQQVIDAGTRMSAFLDDPAVVGSFTRLGDRYVAEMRSAQEPAKVLQLHAKLQVLDDIQRELRITRDAGTRAAHERTQRELRQAQRKPSR